MSRQPYPLLLVDRYSETFETQFAANFIFENRKFWIMSRDPIAPSVSPEACLCAHTYFICLMTTGRHGIYSLYIAVSEPEIKLGRVAGNHTPCPQSRLL